MEIYAISDGVNRVKIGISVDTEKRLRQLQTGNPHPLKIIYKVTVENFQQALAVEQAIHKNLKFQKTSGEWFINCLDIPIERCCYI